MRHFVQCATQSCEKPMISRNFRMHHTLAKSSKAPFVNDNIKTFSSQEWAVIEKEVHLEHGKRGNQGMVSSIANQMKLNTGDAKLTVRTYKW